MLPKEMNALFFAGNMNSSGFKLTDLYISPEAAASMRSWDFSLVPEVVREQMFRKSDGIPIANLFGIDIQEHEDLGIGQPLQQLMTLPTNEGGLEWHYQAVQENLYLVWMVETPDSMLKCW